jgi:hypothetical protein
MRTPIKAQPSVLTTKMAQGNEPTGVGHATPMAYRAAAPNDPPAATTPITSHGCFESTCRERATAAATGASAVLRDKVRCELSDTTTTPAHHRTCAPVSGVCRRPPGRESTTGRVKNAIQRSQPDHVEQQVLTFGAITRHLVRSRTVRTTESLR